MAVTKIHGIKTTVDKAIEYICNPAKTDENIFISSFACAPETAALDFLYTLDHTTESAHANKAFHLIQAFAPGEVSYEEAHTIGKELADEVLEGKYSYVLTTHIDKGHIHNHIIFCAADNFHYNHYHDCKKSYWHIRRTNDKLCVQHGLSVITPSGIRGQKYNEWNTNKTDSSWKTQIRKDINHAIKLSATYDEFIIFMKTKGYDIKNATLSDQVGKYISFRPIGKDRFVRGSVRSLGRNYTREKIAERIQTQQIEKPHNSNTHYHLQQLIDISSSKNSQDIKLQKWANKENLKIATQTYNQLVKKNIHSFPELNQKINTLSDQAKSTSKSIVSIEKQLRELAEIIKYTKQYIETKPYHDRYVVSNNQEDFFRKSETQILLYFGAERMLQRFGFSPQNVNLNKLLTKYKMLENKHKDLCTLLHTEHTELKELTAIFQNLQKYLQPSSKEFSKTQGDRIHYDTIK